MEQRRLGRSGISVSPIALGCWPLAGMTSGPVPRETAVATVRTCFETGVNFLDTAYCYGMQGESETAIGEALGTRRGEIVVATKGGIHWEARGTQRRDARPETLHRQCRESLTRLRTDHVDLYYLHAPDPETPIADSAGAIRELIEEGFARAAGVSNVTVEQLIEFEAVCPVAAVQPPYNMLQRDIEERLLPYCHRNEIAVVVYWPLLKGLLAGKFERDRTFDPNDGRAKYPMFQGEELRRNLDFVDELRELASRAKRTVAEIVLYWTIQRPGVTAALWGAKSPKQARENAACLKGEFPECVLAEIDAAIVRRGAAATARAVR